MVEKVKNSDSLWEEWGLIGEEHEVNFWGDGNILPLDILYQSTKSVSFKKWGFRLIQVMYLSKLI